MPCFTCLGGRTNVFATLSRATAKSAGARLRQMGALSTDPAWSDRAAACERCPLRVIRGGISYCGTPFLEYIHRDPATDGCGCPTREKARSPSEHCPLNARNLPAAASGGACDCKWCSQEH